MIDFIKNYELLLEMLRKERGREIIGSKTKNQPYQSTTLL